MASIEETVSRTYDFIIIGGGTAGLTIAARLTEDPSMSVLVLEAGPNKLGDPRVDIPALFSTLYEDPEYDWCFKTVPQENANGRVIAQPRGKLLGGSSAINFMMLAHASAADIDNWSALGNPLWTSTLLAPYYKKFESYHAPSAALACSLGGDIMSPSLHGSSGPVHTTYPHGTDATDGLWRPTFQALGLGAEHDPRKMDEGGHSTLGGYNVLRFIDEKAKRVTSASAFYAPNEGRENLVVLTGAFVRKVVFGGDGEVRAEGVEFEVEGREYVVKAGKEVVLCAGTFQSPQLLELSGIGDREILGRHGVECVVHNPNVGENLQDHMLVPLEVETIDGIATAETIKQPGVLDWAMGEWQAGRGGPLGSGVSGTSFLSYPSILPASDSSSFLEVASEMLAVPYPGISERQFAIQKAQFESESEADVQFNFGKTGFDPYVGDCLSALFKHNDPGHYLGIATASTHPFSRGNVHIASFDPKAKPLIDPRYLSHPLDVEILAQGVLFAQKILETAPLADVVRVREDGDGKKIQPSFKISERMGIESARKLVVEAAISSWHPIGTCSMLPREDGGVVDERLRVWGVKSLRVIDASVVPLHVRGNVCSAVYAIAERGADMIKEDWGMEIEAIN